MLKNLLSLLSAEILIRLIGLFITIYLGRTLGVENFGLLNFAFAIAAYFALPVNFGFTDYGILHVSRDRTAEHIGFQVGQLLGLRLTIGIGCMVILITASYLVPRLQEIQPLIWAAGILIFTYALSLEWLFTAIEKMTIIAVARVLGSVFLAISVVLLIENSDDLTQVAFLQAGREGLITVLLLVMAGARITRISFRIDLAAWKSTLRFVLPIGLSTFLALAHANFDLILVGFLVDSEQLGWYAATLHLIGTAAVAQRLLAQVLLPRLATIAHVDKSVERVGRALQRYLTTAAVFITAFGCYLSADIIAVTFGNEYSGAVLPLQIGIWRVGLELAGMIFVRSIFIRNQNRFAFIFAISVAVNIALNFTLIPPLGITGSATAYVISTAMLFYLARREILNIGIRIPISNGLVPALIAGAAMSVTFFASSSLGFFAQAGLGTIVFAGVLWATGMRLDLFLEDLKLVQNEGTH